MIREAVKLAALNALRGVVVKFVLPLAVVLVLVGGLIGGIVAAIFGGTGTAANAGSDDCTVSTTAGKKVNLHASQIEVARALDEGVRQIGFSGKVSRLVIIAAWGESTLQNLAIGDGATNPDGSLATSIGVLQQQHFWGSREERMNPATAAQLFVLGPNRGGGGLADVPGWADMSETEAIHRVQKNADPNHYARSVEPADAVIREAGIDVNRPGKNYSGGQTDAPGGGSHNGTGSGCRAGQPGGNANGGDTYPWLSKTPGPGIYHEDGLGFYLGECTSYVAWKLNELNGATGTDPSGWAIGNNRGGNGSHLGNAAEWRDAWVARGWRVSTTPVANSVAWWGAYGGSGIGEAGHVAWVDAVQEDGRVVLSEYNNPSLAPPGHRYSKRQPAVSTAQAYLVPPDEFIKAAAKPEEKKEEEKTDEERPTPETSGEEPSHEEQPAPPAEERTSRRWSGG